MKIIYRAYPYQDSSYIAYFPNHLSSLRGTPHHREDGPAVEGFNGYQAWYKNGQLHRDDGPAIIWANGQKDWYKLGLLIKSNV